MATWQDIYRNAALPICLVGAVNWVPKVFGKPDFVDGFFGEGAGKHLSRAVYAIVGVAALFAITWTSFVHFKSGSSSSAASQWVWGGMIAALAIIGTVYFARKAYDKDE